MRTDSTRFLNDTLCQHDVELSLLTQAYITTCY